MLEVGLVLQKAVLITVFVAAMMVLVDWLNVLTSGAWQRALCGTRWLQYLAASSVVQDGHGMLPLLAESWRDFIKVKAINLAAGLIVGLLLLLFGP